MRRLLFIPLAGVVAAAAGMLFPFDDPRALIYFRSILVVAALLTSINGFITARQFAPGDHLYASWLLLASGYAVAAVRYGMRIQLLVTGHGVTSRTVLDTMLVVQNLCIAICLFLFVRSWKATGLATPGSRASQITWTILGIVVAVAVGGYPLVQGFNTLNADTVLLVSTLGDMIGIALIVPLAMPALALRGGFLMPVWASIAACEFFWLLYDIWYALKPAMILQPVGQRGVEEMLRLAAILLACVAAVAQRRAGRMA
jgi:hypothetical protein